MDRSRREKVLCRLGVIQEANLDVRKGRDVAMVDGTHASGESSEYTQSLCATGFLGP